MEGDSATFSKEVQKLTRPYVPITEYMYNTLRNGQDDYFVSTGGVVMIFGKASTDEGDYEFALIPLNTKEAAKLNGYLHYEVGTVI